MKTWYNILVIDMNNVLFICYGNICRSPMAEMIFKDMIRNNHKNYMITCKSRATSIEEIGNDLYYQAKDVLSKNKVTIERHAAKKVTKDDIEEANYVIVMENRNKDDLIDMFGVEYESKIRLLLDNEEIEDPWYTGNFLKVYEQINRGCGILFDEIIRRNSNEI